MGHGASVRCATRDARNRRGFGERGASAGTVAPAGWLWCDDTACAALAERGDAYLHLILSYFTVTSPSYQPFASPALQRA